MKLQGKKPFQMKNLLPKVYQCYKIHTSLMESVSPFSERPSCMDYPHFYINILIPQCNIYQKYYQYYEYQQYLHGCKFNLQL